MRQKLKSIEQSVLRQLEADGRVPLTKIGKKIKTSQQRVSYTINTLTERGIFKGFYTLIDYSKLNMLSFRVYFKVSYIDEKKLEQLIAYLVKDPHTGWIETCGGRYDLLCVFYTQNPSRFNKTLRAIMAQFPQQLQRYTVLTVAVIRYFGRKYFFNDPARPELIIGGDRQPEQVDENDLTLMHELAASARKSSVELSNKLDTTPKTIISRIKKLQARSIIRGFRPWLDLRRIGFVVSLVLIRYHNMSSTVEKKLIRFLNLHPNVLSVVKTLGEWDLEIELEAGDMRTLRTIEMEIRKKFALLIQQIESIPLYRSHKKNFFPQFLVEEKE